MANSDAKFIPARVLIGKGDVGDTRLLLEDVVHLWSDADDDYQYLRHAREALASIGGWVR